MFCYVGLWTEFGLLKWELTSWDKCPNVIKIYIQLKNNKFTFIHGLLQLKPHFFKMNYDIKEGFPSLSAYTGNFDVSFLNSAEI